MFTDPIMWRKAKALTPDELRAFNGVVVKCPAGVAYGAEKWRRDRAGCDPRTRGHWTPAKAWNAGPR